MASNLSMSQEDYLEAIYKIVSDKGVARVRDIAGEKNVSMASVNGAIKRLEKLDFVKHDKYEYIELTEKGKKLARHIVVRHELLKRFLNEILKVDIAKAEEDACKMEHDLSDETVEGFVRFFNFIDSDEKISAKWLSKFHEAI